MRISRRLRSGALTATAMLTAVLVATAVGGPTASAAQSATLSGRPPIVIGHRGASGYRPEHTLASYQLAAELGADYVEPDLVSTKDGALVARHENEISGTTDIAVHPEFAARKATKVIDGQSITGWFTEDFTLAELKTLRAKERLPNVRPANTAFDGLYEIPTLQEVIDLAKREGVGIYPETKHPSYFDSIGLSLEEPLVAILTANGYTHPNDPVFIQSFETANLRQLRTMTRLPLIQLIGGSGQPYDFTAKGDSRTYTDLLTPAGLREIATYAQGIGPDKTRIVPTDATGHLQPATSLVTDAHRARLLVHPYTFRRENNFLAVDFRQGNPASPAYLQATGDLPAELTMFYRLGVDGVFTDHADVGVAVRDRLTRRPGAR